VGSTVATTYSEAKMYKDFAKCYCGATAKLTFLDTPGRVRDQQVTVRNVPVYVCARCGEETLTGPISLKYAERVREAVLSGAKVIDF